MSDLSDLFQKDPLSLTKTDLNTVIDFYRAHRHQYNLVKEDGSLKKVRVKKAVKKTKVDERQLDLEAAIAASKEARHD